MYYNRLPKHQSIYWMHSIIIIIVITINEAYL